MKSNNLICIKISMIELCFLFYDVYFYRENDETDVITNLPT